MQQATPPGHLNALHGRVRDLVPDGGRVRLRVGELRCECDAAHAQQLALEHGLSVQLTFPASAVRLVQLDADGADA